jgi:formate hydrogenlyase subunit 6/NADH:ubiquinone oxidoreductase subunit I
MLKISVEKLDRLYAAIAADRDLFLPVESEKQVEFSHWEPGVKVDLDTLTTKESAKSLFFPQSENIVAFRRNGKNFSLIESHDPARPFAVFGVRPCDAKSFALLDRVFLSQPADTFFQDRRENGLIISLACDKPNETCFCRNFGIDAAEPAFCDVAAWLTEDALYWKPVTEKGEAMTEKIGALFDETEDAAALEAGKAAVRAALAKLPFRGLDMKGFGGEHELARFNSAAWRGLSEACLGCGTCTFICPVCQCYDICEFDTGRDIRRFRCWDSCMYSEFTKMSAGQPRPTQMERFRQRFMHKLVYFPAGNEGEYACVGCGRCLTACPISMNIVKVIKTLGEEEVI